MAGPSPAPTGLRSPAAQSLYNQYKLYYQSVLSGQHQWKPPPTPPPPPSPLPTCLKAEQNGTVSFILLSSDAGLCAPAPGKDVSHVRQAVTKAFVHRGNRMFGCLYIGIINHVENKRLAPAHAPQRQELCPVVTNDMLLILRRWLLGVLLRPSLW